MHFKHLFKKKARLHKKVCFTHRNTTWLWTWKELSLERKSYIIRHWKRNLCRSPEWGRIPQGREGVPLSQGKWTGTLQLHAEGLKIKKNWSGVPSSHQGFWLYGCLSRSCDYWLLIGKSGLLCIFNNVWRNPLLCRSSERLNAAILQNRKISVF